MSSPPCPSVSVNIRYLWLHCVFQFTLVEHDRDWDGLWKPLQEFAGFFPALLEGTQGDLLELLKESDEAIKEGVVHVLAKAGGSIRDQISEKERYDIWGLEGMPKLWRWSR